MKRKTSIPEGDVYPVVSALRDIRAKIVELQLLLGDEQALAVIEAIDVKLSAMIKRLEVREAPL